MKVILILAGLAIWPLPPAEADFWGGDLPLLAEIVTNTLQTLHQMREQTGILRNEMDGIREKIDRIQTIANVVQPAQWEKWKDPTEALRRLQLVYQTMPKEYRSPKADEIESEIAQAMNLVSRVGPEAHTTFLSGKELERRGADASPGVAQKLAASGVGSLVAMEAQTQVIQCHITSLLAQMLADANEKETRMVISKGRSFADVSENLGEDDGKFSTHVFPKRDLK